MRNWSRNFFYLIPFLYFCFGTFYWGSRLNYEVWGTGSNLIVFLQNWGNLTTENLLTPHSIFLFHICVWPWTFLVFYFQKIKSLQYRIINKSIWLILLFWLSLIIFSWLAGLDSYISFWFTINSLLIFWGYLGLFGSVFAILTSISTRLKSKVYYTFQKIDSIKYISILGKYESALLIFIQFIIGISLSINDVTLPTRIHGSYLFLTPLMIIVFTIIAVDFLFLFNFILSMKTEYYIPPKKEILDKSRKKSKILLEKSRKKSEILLEKARNLIDKKKKRYSIKSFNITISALKSTVKNYEKKSNNNEISEKDKLLLKGLDESLIYMYKKRAEIYETNALKSYQKNLLTQARNEWEASIDDLNLCSKLSISNNLPDMAESCENSILNVNHLLNQLKVEISIIEIDKKLNEVKNNKSLQKTNLPKAIEIVNNIILSYSEAKEETELSDELKDIQDKLELRIQKAQLFRAKLQNKMDESIGLREIPTILTEGDRDSILSIIREYEFIGGQIRFKVGVINNTNYTFTSLRLAFDLPEALKWIIHEPKYERKGDSILISKLGAHEKLAVSLYLEPINCMESSVNVTASFFDAKEKPHAVPMKPKMIAISCPIFFTENEANLARVKSLRRSLANRDKKVFPIANREKGASVFSSILSVLGKFDIKLVYKEFDEESNYGEAWFYGITKVKKNRIIPYVMLDTENKVLEFEVAGDDAEQITSFLAEIGDRVRRKLIHDKVIKPEEKFFDMRITVMSNFCPYCYTLISDDSVQKFLRGESISCKNCLAVINLDER
ncbi:MAG: hypothetical protein ACFE9Z_01105 [Promethearchaeota archaeon]